MKKLILILGLALLIPARASWAQLRPRTRLGYPWATYILRCRTWRRAGSSGLRWEAYPARWARTTYYKFPGVLILLQEGRHDSGSVGSVVGHIGFHVPEPPKRWPGGRPPESKPKWVTNPGPGLCVDAGRPDEVEILEDKTQTVPIAFHHVHFYVADTGGGSNVLEMQSWYAKMFGAKPGKRAQFEAADLPGVNLTFSQIGHADGDQPKGACSITSDSRSWGSRPFARRPKPTE